MTERTDFIATLQACYFGDKNAFEKVLRIYDEKQDKIDKAIEYIEEVQNFPHTNINQHKDMKELKEILRGDNNE